MRQVEILVKRLLAVANDHQIDEIGQGFRVDVRDCPADQDQRVAFVALGSQKRDAKHGQHVQQVDVVVLVRQRKTDHMKVSGGPLRFD